MNVALIGAGFVGSALLNELVQRHHQVKVLVRNPQKVTQQSDNVTIVTVDAMNADEVAEGVRGQDVVVSAYNAGWENPNLYDDFLQGSKAIQAGVKQAGVPRLLVVGGAGSLFIGENQQLVDSPDFPAEYKAGASSARDYLNLLKTENELDWTYLSPAIEMHPGTSGERKGTYRENLEQPIFNEDGRSIISVEDLAVAIVDELENPKYSRQRFTVAY